MAHRAAAARGVVSGDRMFAHEAADGGGAGGGLARLQQAVRHGHQVVAAAAVKAESGAVRRAGDGENGLVAVSQRLCRGQDGGRLDIEAAYAAQGVVHPRELHPQLRFVAHVHHRAAAAAAIGRAGRLAAVGGGAQQLLAAAIRHAGRDLDGAHAPELAWQGARNKNGAPGDAADAVALRGGTADFALIYVIFLQNFHADILSRRGRYFNRTA